MKTEDNKAALGGLMKVVEGIVTVEEENINLVRQFKDIRAVYHMLAQHEITRLKILEGEDHPRVLGMEKVLDQNMKIIGMLSIEEELLKIKVPGTTGKDILVRGTLTDKNKVGIKDQFVVLTDSKGNEVDVGEIKTDETGHFTLAINSNKLKMVEEKAREDLHLTVMTPERKVCYQSPKPIKLAEGSVVEKNITLPPGQTAASSVKAKKTSITTKTKSVKGKIK